MRTETSLLAYAEFLVAAYTEDDGFEFEVIPVVAHMLDVVPLSSPEEEGLLLAAATHLDDHGLTPFDALHAAHAATRHGGCSSGPIVRTTDFLIRIAVHSLRTDSAPAEDG